MMVFTGPWSKGKGLFLGGPPRVFGDLIRPLAETAVSTKAKTWGKGLLSRFFVHFRPEKNYGVRVF